ncbi:hypothetical protein B2I21_08440 [Chryseobacterium mucoviscidosis]|nr:hypothetical protein B2I21_08440 [Chryseobacterium mucoviscidosis]
MKTASKEDWVSPDEVVEHLVTVPGLMWDRVQEIRTSRNQENTNKPEIEKILITKSPLLFVGMIKCGYCGSPLTTTYNSKKYQLKDGTEQKWRRAKYRCSGKALGKVDCEGQTIYSQTKIEETTLEELFSYLDELKTVDVSEQLKVIGKTNTNDEEKKTKSMKKQFNELEKELGTLLKEVSKSITGKSAFKPELLNTLIEEKQIELEQIRKEIANTETIALQKKVERSEMESLVKLIPVWKDSFQNAGLEKKKMMLNSVIDTITVYRDSIDLKIKLNVHELVQMAIKNGSETNSLGRAHRWQR